ncbi:MAG: pyruvate formate lyase-activating protein [Firmicutes bacterium]|nr:pyruvate formate lyase-activating protein [Bacillota bacterium]
MFGSISKIESMGLKDGPGIRTVIFLNGCKLRCKYCHNPETWLKQENNISVNELVEKILRYKNYYGEDGGVTLSGGEPLLQIDFIIELCKKLKENNINIALDTSGTGIGKYDEILKYIDLVLFDIKDTTPEGFKDLTGTSIEESQKFITILNETKIPVWIRQVIIPGYNDNYEYMHKLNDYIKEIRNVEKIELLPYHNMAISKYNDLNIDYPLLDTSNMDKLKCNELESYINSIRK